MRVVTVPSVLALLVVLAACGGEDTEEPPDPVAEEEAAEQEADDAGEEDAAGDGEVAIVEEGGFAFAPDEVDVAVGDTVIWTHEGEVPHTVTADDGAFDSGNLEGGDTFEHTFDEAGSFPYTCALHPAMTGTVSVE